MDKPGNLMSRLAFLTSQYFYILQLFVFNNLR